ncbi:MAG: hypothetical protein HYZ85_02635 [Candidatus Omnitrophica bacterium]|nr:hypothetical protein [Candidatus Omnitrophota bacterium]
MRNISGHEIGGICHPERSEGSRFFAEPTARRSDRTAPQDQAPDRRSFKRRCRMFRRPTAARLTGVAALLRMTVFIILPFCSVAFADVSDVVSSAKQAIVNVKESSKQLFEESQIRQPVLKEDGYVRKMRRKREEFLEEQVEERRDFMEKIRKNEGMDRHERQKKIAKFKRKENKELQKFMEKQKEKLKKHFEKEKL